MLSVAILTEGKKPRGFEHLLNVGLCVRSCNLALSLYLLRNVAVSLKWDALYNTLCFFLFCFLFFFLFFLFFYCILFLNFTILYWFCQISKWIHHRYTCVPHPEPSSLLPPHTLLLGRPSTPAPSIQYHASNLDWRLVYTLWKVHNIYYLRVGP